MERVAYRRMRNSSRISARIFTSKIRIRNALAKAFGFERSPKTFHRCVFVAVAFAAHRSSCLVLGQQASELFAGMLTSSIRVL
jgi:hypothetical protein